MVTSKTRRNDRRNRTPSASPVVDGLMAAEAQEVLRQLLGRYPHLGAEADEIAKALLRAVSFESVARVVEKTFDDLDWDDAPKAPTPWSYQEPVETAWGALQQTLDRFLQNLKRHVDLGLETEALEICKGILLGLYRLRDQESSHDLLSHAADFLDEAAGQVCDTWRAARRGPNGKRRRRDRPEFPEAFARRYLRDWEDRVID